MLRAEHMKLHVTPTANYPVFVTYGANENEALSVWSGGDLVQVFGHNLTWEAINLLRQALDLAETRGLRKET